MIAERLDEQYFAIVLQIDSVFMKWHVNDVADLQHFSNHHRHNWMCRGDAMNECGIAVLGGRLVSALPLPTIA